MTKPAVFTQGDTSKLLRGAKAAGATVTRIVIEPSGRIVAEFGKPADEQAEANEWDVVFDAEAPSLARSRRR